MFGNDQIRQFIVVKIIYRAHILMMNNFPHKAMSLHLLLLCWNPRKKPRIISLRNLTIRGIKKNPWITNAFTQKSFPRKITVLFYELNYKRAFSPRKSWVSLALEREKIRHVNLLRIIHAMMVRETDHHHQPLELCMPPSVGGFWQETFLHVNSDWALLALQSLLCWEGRCQIAQSQIKSIESERMASFVSRSILLWIQCTKSRWSLSLFSYHPGGLKTMTAPKSHC